MPASRGGKLKTLLQGVAIGLYLLPLPGLLATGRGRRSWRSPCVVTVVTGVDYVVRALTLRRTSDAGRDEARARKAAR